MTLHHKPRFISVSMRLKKVMSGYHADGTANEINIVSPDFFRNIVNIDNIIRSDEDHIFIRSSGNTIEAWEYEGKLRDIKNALCEAGVL